MNNVAHASHIYEMACLADKAIRGQTGTINLIEGPMSAEALPVRYLTLTENLLREMADALAAKRAEISEPAKVAA